MDLHSYAKRRTTKKWAIEHKRRLVDARITHDAMFAKHPAISLVPWKKFIGLAKLDDYSVVFVRKQWYNMVAKYKLYKQNRLRNIPTKAMDNDIIQKTTQEWEFFEPIHRFMTSKITNLHSYALKEPNTNTTLQQQQKDIHMQSELKQPKVDDKQHKQKCIAQNESTSESERINTFSCFTNENYAASMGIRNDHDFYSKRICLSKDNDRQQLNYFADASEDTQDSSINPYNNFVVVQQKFDNFMQQKQLLDRSGQEEVRDFLYEEIAVTVTPPPPSPTSIEQQIKLEIDSMNEDEQQLEQTDFITDDIVVKQELLHDDECDAVIEQQQLVGEEEEEETVQRDVGGSGEIVVEETNKEKESTKVNHRRSQYKTDRAKYYRHKRRYNHRLERRFDAILNVFGQIIQTEYPSIDISALSALSPGNTTTSASGESSDEDGPNQDIYI